MPIRPENKDRYPKDWSRISLSIRERAKWRCEFCGIQGGQLGGRDYHGNWHPALPLRVEGQRTIWPVRGTRALCEAEPAPIKLKIIKIILTVAHLDHTPENCDPSNLKALCQKCHLDYDKDEHRRSASDRRRRQFAIRDLFPRERRNGNDDASKAGNQESDIRS